MPSLILPIQSTGGQLRLSKATHAPLDVDYNILSLEFSRQQYWNRLSFPSPGNVPNPETEPRSPTLQVNSLLSESNDQGIDQTRRYNTCRLICTQHRRI